MREKRRCLATDADCPGWGAAGSKISPMLDFILIGLICMSVVNI